MRVINIIEIVEVKQKKLRVRIGNISLNTESQAFKLHCLLQIHTNLELGFNLADYTQLLITEPNFGNSISEHYCVEMQKIDEKWECKIYELI